MQFSFYKFILYVYSNFLTGAADLLFLVVLPRSSVLLSLLHGTVASDTAFFVPFSEVLLHRSLAYTRDLVHSELWFFPDK